MISCLVVEDDESNRDINKILCRALNMEVKSAENGDEAIKICEEAMPDLVLLDWIMPKTDGLEFIRTLRKMKNGKNTYILMCSSIDDENKIEEALKTGANRYLPKPFTPPVLMKAIMNSGIIETKIQNETPPQQK